MFLLLFNSFFLEVNSDILNKVLLLSIRSIHASLLVIKESITLIESYWKYSVVISKLKEIILLHLFIFRNLCIKDEADFSILRS